VGRSNWWPRDGRPMEGAASIGQIHRHCMELLERIPSKLLHPVWGILVATLCTVVGRSDLLLRSAGLLLAALWLSLDIWAWLLRRQWYRWAYILGCLFTSMILVAVMGVMWWWLDGKLQEQRQDALQHIRIEYTIPAGYKYDPLESMFTVTNNSSQTLSGKHQIACFVNLIVVNGGTVTIDKLSLAQHYPKGWEIISGSLSKTPIKELSPIEPGGDAITESCLSLLEPRTFDCADIVLTFQYYLQTQPSTLQQVKTRIVTYETGDGGFQWYKQGLDQPGSDCARFVRPQ
jgi:hypothetical protein